MKRRAIKFCDFVLRGYAQIFLASRARSGILFLAAIAVLSPWLALHSLIGATASTATALRFRMGRALAKTGFVSVNGVLLGCAWFAFPEISELNKALLTGGGAICVTILLVPVASRLRDRNSAIGMFSLPAVFAIWASIALAYGFGLSHPALKQGWSALQRGDSEYARKALMTFKSDAASVEAQRMIELGWTEYGVRDYGAAEESFQQATELCSENAEAFSGLGWSLLKRGQFANAEEAFQAAIARDAWTMDGWDGMGWAVLEAGRYDEAKNCFNRALLAAPFLKDAWSGKGACELQLRGTDDLVRSQLALHAIDDFVPVEFQRTPSRQLVCWALFVLGIAAHSRRSLLAGIGGTIAFVLYARQLSLMNAALKDVEFYYNVVPMFVAFGGQYLRWNFRALVWSGILAVCMALIWPHIGNVRQLGIPVSCLPFNVALIGSLAFFASVDKCSKTKQVVPLDVAATSPEQVALWWQKCDIAAAAWKELDEVSVSR